jgi:three-Cys-motif partner protein
MAKPMESLWDIEPHTKAKHEILERYLDAWFPILSTYNQRIIYLDGFCGPGRYKGGEDGSPIIAIKKALNHFGRLQDRKIAFIFIDERKDRIEHLRSEIASMTIPSNFSIFTEVLEFEKTVSQILRDLKSKNLNLAPTFAFIDPFGFKGIPFSLVKELLNNPKTEVFINIMADFINRFVEHPDVNTQQHIVELFGGNQALELIANGGDRLETLRQLYQTQLQTCAKYVRYFEMKNEQGRLIYYLFFASKHPLGFVKMKEAFWKVDPESGFHFSDKTNPAQMILLSLDPSHDLVKIIGQKFSEQRATVSQIKQFVEEDTSYIGKHMRQALNIMETDGKIQVDALKLDGTKRRRGSFPDDARVTFSK